MTKLSAGEIKRLLEVVIGKCEPVGDTWEDHDRTINLRTLIDVAENCIDGVMRVAETTGMEWSVIESREIAIRVLKKWEQCIHEVLEEV